MYTHTARAATREGLSVTAHESRAAKAKVVISSDPMRAKPGRKSTARYTLEHKHPRAGPRALAGLAASCPHAGKGEPLRRSRCFNDTSQKRE